MTFVNEQISQIQAEITQLEGEIAKYPTIPNNVQREEIAAKEVQLSQARALLGQYTEIQTNLIFIGRPVTSGVTTSDDVRIASLQLTLNLYQQLYLNLMSNLQSVQLTRLQNTPILTLVEPATPPKNPSSPQTLFYMAIAGLVGLMLASGGILVFHYLDTTIKSASEVEELLGLPTLVKIPNQKQPKKGLILEDQKTASKAQIFHKLGALLELAQDSSPKKSLLVTSAGLKEGKTTVAANLALSYSRQGKKVILIDANFNNPKLDSLLGLSNDEGFAEILGGNKNVTIHQYANGVNDGFMVIPTGQTNKRDVLYQTEILSKTLEELKQKADLLIFDAAPLSNYDALLLASHTDGVLLVIQPGHTDLNAAIDITQQLKRQKTNILGVVINRNIPEYDNAQKQKPSLASG